MVDICFCGHAGRLADREPIYAGDGEWGLLCPACGHLDRLAWLPEATRGALLDEAARRIGMRAANRSDDGSSRPARAA
jgi:hypothetical protein